MDAVANVEGANETVKSSIEHYSRDTQDIYAGGPRMADSPRSRECSAVSRRESEISRGEDS